MKESERCSLNKLTSSLVAIFLLTLEFQWAITRKQKQKQKSLNKNKNKKQNKKVKRD
jgi:preprotein translocase subunit SecG